MFVVDTNVLVRAADQDSPYHEPCRALVEQWRQQTTSWYLTWGILYEFIRVVTHPRVLESPWDPESAIGFVTALLEAPGTRVLQESDRHVEVARDVFHEIAGIGGNLVFDVHTAILMREHGLRTIYTSDADFNRFPFLDVVDPLTGRGRTAIRERRQGWSSGARRRS